jgi:hypothetical protein
MRSIHIGVNAGSWPFRFAEQAGKAEQWNWREYPTQKTAERVAAELMNNELLTPTEPLHAMVV